MKVFGMLLQCIVFRRSAQIAEQRVRYSTFRTMYGRDTGDKQTIGRRGGGSEVNKNTPNSYKRYGMTLTFTS